MKTYYLVYSYPVEGMEAAYNQWYSNVHLKEVLQIEGFNSAKRFELTPTQLVEEQEYKYLAMYEIDSDDVEGTKQRLIEAASWLEMSPALDLKLHVSIYKSITYRKKIVGAWKRLSTPFDHT